MQRKDRDTPWSLKGVRPEVREMAKAAAARAGVPVGTWLSAAIRSVGEAELAVAAKRGAPAGAPSAIERALAPGGAPQAAPPGEPADFATDDVEVQKLLDRTAARDGRD